MDGIQPFHQCHHETSKFQDAPLGSLSYFGIARLRTFDFRFNKIRNFIEQRQNLIEGAWLSKHPNAVLTHRL